MSNIRIKKLKESLKKVKLKQLDKLIQQVSKVEKMNLCINVSSAWLKILKKKGSISLYHTEANTLHDFLTKKGVDASIHTEFGDIDVYSYWPGDEISYNRTVILD